MAARARPRRRVTRVFLRMETWLLRVVAPPETALRQPGGCPTTLLQTGNVRSDLVLVLTFLGARFRHRLWKWSRSIAAGMSQKGQFRTLSYVRGCFEGPLSSARDVRKTTVSDPVFIEGLSARRSVGTAYPVRAVPTSRSWLGEVRQPTGQRDGRSPNSSCRPVRLDT